MANNNNAKLMNAPAEPERPNKPTIGDWANKAKTYLKEIQTIRNNVKSLQLTHNNATNKAANINSKIDANVKTYKTELTRLVENKMNTAKVGAQTEEYKGLVKRIATAHIAKLYRTKTIKLELKAKHAMMSWDTLKAEITTAFDDHSGDIKKAINTAKGKFTAGFFVDAFQEFKSSQKVSEKLLKRKLNLIEARVRGQVGATNGTGNGKTNGTGNGKTNSQVTTGNGKTNGNGNGKTNSQVTTAPAKTNGKNNGNGNGKTNSQVTTAPAKTNGKNNGSSSSGIVSATGNNGQGTAPAKTNGNNNNLSGVGNLFANNNNNSQGTGGVVGPSNGTIGPKTLKNTVKNNYTKLKANRSNLPNANSINGLNNSKLQELAKLINVKNAKNLKLNEIKAILINNPGNPAAVAEKVAEANEGAKNAAAAAAAAAEEEAKAENSQNSVTEQPEN